MTKLIIDEQIPFVSNFFSNVAELVFFPNKNITQANLKNADGLLIRTVTHADKNLLENTSIRFLGTTATGTDHIDQDYLKQAKIQFADAAGCNANAVQEYVLSCINDCIAQSLLKKTNAVIGIIGLGRIGGLIASTLKKRGFEILYYDPFVLNQTDFNSVPLKQLIAESDLVSLHTPLICSGSHPTFHLLHADLLRQIKTHAILMNTARGPVIDQNALLKIKNIYLCLDVWETEPAIHLDLLNKVTIGTPHIAGYSFDAKYRATEMIYHQAAHFFNWKNNKKIALKHRDDLELISSDFHPIAYTKIFKEKFDGIKNQNQIKNIFIRERQNFPLRRESV